MEEQRNVTQQDSRPKYKHNRHNSIAGGIARLVPRRQGKFTIVCPDATPRDGGWQRLLLSVKLESYVCSPETGHAPSLLKLCKKVPFSCRPRHFERSEKSHSGFGSVVEGDLAYALVSPYGRNDGRFVSWFSYSLYYAWVINFLLYLLCLYFGAVVLSRCRFIQ